MPCTIVVSRDWLHALVQSHAYHHEHEYEPVAYAVGSDAQVSAVFAQLLVYEKRYQTRRGIHEERSETYRKRILGHTHVQAHDAFLEMEGSCPVAEVLHHHNHCNSLRDDRRPCRSCYAHIETEYEYRVQDGVEEHCEYSERHGLLRVSRRPHGRVESEIKVGDDVADQDDLHVFLCVWEGVLAGTEEVQNRVYESQCDNHEYQSDDYVQTDYVSENLVGSLVVLLSQEDGQHGRRSRSYQCAEGGGKVHQRECDRKTGNGQRAYALADEDAVHHIVQRCRCLRYDGRQGILLEQSAYLFCSEF